MRIHLLSDLHLDFASFTPPPTDADLVILAGDIGEGTSGLVWAKETLHVPVIYIAGNHEYYSCRGTQATYEQTHAALKEEARGSHVHFLENEAIIFGNVRFLCATLWTDFELYGDIDKGMASAQIALSDFNGAICTDMGYFRPDDALVLHHTSRAWLGKELSRPWDGVTVVVTHFLPSTQSIAQRWVGEPGNTGFASRLNHLVEKADLWVHGHTHDSSDYQIGKCRVVCNPRGYAHKNSPQIAENTAFNPSLVLTA